MYTAIRFLLSHWSSMNRRPSISDLSSNVKSLKLCATFVTDLCILSIFLFFFFVRRPHYCNIFQFGTLLPQSIFSSYFHWYSAGIPNVGYIYHPPPRDTFAFFRGYLRVRENNYYSMYTEWHNYWCTICENIFYHNIKVTEIQCLTFHMLVGLLPRSSGSVKLYFEIFAQWSIFLEAATAWHTNPPLP